MVMPAQGYIVPQEVQNRLVDFCKSTRQILSDRGDVRARFEYIDKEYIRENNIQEQSTKSRGANMMGNKRKIADIVIPVVEPQTDTALAYLTSVFCTGVPLFGVVADAANIDQARSLETVIDNSARRGGWTRHFIKFFRDGLKYNFHALEVSWCKEVVYSLQTNAQFSAVEGKPTEIMWEGNKVIRLDPYNTIYDPRVAITEQHEKAEFAGYTELMNKVTLARYLAKLPYRMNVTKAYEAATPASVSVGSPNELFYIPKVYTENLSFARMGIMNWDSWAMGGKMLDRNNPGKGLYILVTRYLRIIPKEFGMAVPNRGQAQIWKLVTVNDQVVVYLERMTNAHDYLPIIFGQPTEDGLDLQTKSFAQKCIPMQDLASALANSKLAARRRLVADRGLYDPSRVNETDINSDNPAAKIPVKPSVYGQDISKAYYPIPFKDEQTQSLMQDVREVAAYANDVTGQNKSQQGQFVKGNKTKTEFEDTMNKSSGRQQTMALMTEFQVFSPLKEILLLNVLQYQPSGTQYSTDQSKPYNVDTAKLRTAGLQFKVSDGLIPSEKLIDGDTMGQALQTMAQAPEIGQDYAIGDIFAYLMKVKGADLTQFKYSDAQKQARQEQQLKMMDAKAAADAKAKGVPVNGA